MWLVVLLACGEDTTTTAERAEIDVVEMEVECSTNGADSYPDVSSLLDRGVPLSVMAYYLDDEGNVASFARLANGRFAVQCDIDSLVRVIATYPAE